MAVADFTYDSELQAIAAFAAEALGAPVALLSALGDDRQTFLAEVGFGRSETTLEEAFCAHALGGDGVFEVPDAAADPRFAANPLVTGSERVRFYAGVPVASPDGVRHGALCVLGTEPRVLTEAQRRTLAFLARQAEARLLLLDRERAAARAEAEAHRSAELLRLVSERVPVRIAYLDREYRFRFLNDAYLAQVGLSRERALGRTLAETLGEPMFLQAKPNLDRAFAGETHTQEFEALYNTGTRPVRATYVPDRDAEGAVRGVAVQVEDLTAQRSAERAAEEERTNLERTLDTARVATFDWDILNDRVYTNALMAEFYGLPNRSEGNPVTPYFDSVHPDDRKLVADAIGAAVDDGRRYEAQYRVCDASGRPRWVFARGDAARDAEGRAVRLSGVVIDVTERVELDLARQRSDDRYHALFEAIDEGFCVLQMVQDEGGRTVDYRFVELNDAFESQAGVPAALARQGLTIRQIAPDIEEGWIETYGRVARTGVPERFEMGSEVLDRFCEVSAFRLGNEGSLEVGVLFKDVSERRRSERAIAEERARLDRTLETANVATYDWDIVNDRLYGNALLALFFGIPNTPVGNPIAPYFDRINLEDRPAMQAAVQRSIDTGEFYETNYRVLGMDGRERSVFVRGETELDAGGRSLRLTGVIVEITARVSAERSLAETRARLDAVLAAAEIGVWDFDPATGAIGADANLAAMFGIDPETARAAPAETFVARIHPDDQASVAAAFGRAAREGEAYDVEYRTVVEGKVRHLLARGFAERDETGRVVRMPGAVLDITDVKAAQEAERAAQETFRTVFEQAPDDAILVMDRDRTLTGWNPAAERITGWTAEEAIGQAADLIFSPEDVANGGPARETEGAAREGKAADERWHMRRDGSRFWGSGTMNALHDAEGNVTGFLKVFRDATARHEEARTLAFQRRLTDAVIDLRDPETIVRTAERMLGEHLGVTRVLFAEALPDGERVEIREEWAPNGPSIVGVHRMADFGSPFVADCQAGRTHVSRDAERDYAPGAGLEAIREIKAGAGIAIPIQKEGRLAALFVVHNAEPRDWTEDEIGLVRQVGDRMFAELERAQAENALQAANDALEGRVEARTAELAEAVQQAEGFNYSISHDLRTPLRAIVSTASILRDELGPALDEEHRELLERQVHNASRMGRLIDELLRLSRYARVEVRRQPLDMTAKTRSVADSFGDCAVEVQEGMAATGDPDLVRTVLENLVGNAYKFSPDGGTVRVAQSGDVFAVSDEGVGFDMAFAPKIFLPFERLVGDREFEGTGIGLANVKRIVERHGGRVWAESSPGKGATFSFTLAPAREERGL